MVHYEELQKLAAARAADGARHAPPAALSAAGGGLRQQPRPTKRQLEAMMTVERDDAAQVAREQAAMRKGRSADQSARGPHNDQPGPLSTDDAPASKRARVGVCCHVFTLMFAIYFVMLLEAAAACCHDLPLKQLRQLV